MHKDLIVEYDGKILNNQLVSDPSTGKPNRLSVRDPNKTEPIFVYEDFIMNWHKGQTHQEPQPNADPLEECKDDSSAKDTCASQSKKESPAKELPQKSSFESSPSKNQKEVIEQKRQQYEENLKKSAKKDTS